ncbi:hypothetical protein [Marinobacter sp. SS21]|uniref:hypothetical protein n=1 Tax=Marinobacter sp. SS21 TaxID=2979460 RepID=UPI00232D5FCF|nr:hypothetical protein [Marinobacter sp. SS21]MDC0661429.1 hypothetical protein [Marinobacter sp. SS21]
METLIVILAVLFLALFILVPLLEKFAGKGGGRINPKLAKWIFPLMAAVIVLQLIRYYFG